MSRRPGVDEDGFTLVELLVSIVILSIIAITLTTTVILGIRTTDGTGERVGRSAAIQALGSYFTEDAHRAETVSTTDSTECATGDVGLFLRLGWTDQGVARTVSYAFDPPTGGDQQLVRWTCYGSGPPDRRILGVFRRDDGAPVPVAATCTFEIVGTGPCPPVPGAPVTVTLQIQTSPSASPAAPTELTVRRRTT